MPETTPASLPSGIPSAIPTGVYRHYKGPLYTVLGTARHSETEDLHVVYRCEYGDREIWIRPLTMFTGTVVHDGVEQPRFRKTDTQ